VNVLNEKESALKLIQEDIMRHATEWAKNGEGIKDAWGRAAGLVHAYLYITDDKEGYYEYYAMLGIFTDK
jgi:hypothetical protein